MDDVELVVNYRIIEDQLKDIDILFFNRYPPDTSVKKLLEYREKYGFKIVVDNDDYWELGSSHVMNEAYKHYKIDNWIKDCIFIADACTVTHDRLAERVGEINPNVHILPNSIPQFGQFLVPKEKSSLTRLFWAGSHTHLNDIKILQNPLKRFSFSNTVMVMGGYDERSDVLNSMANIYTNGKRLKHKLITFLPVEEYYYA